MLCSMRVFLILITLAACEYRGDDPFRRGGKSPPNFAGLSDAQAYSAYSVMITWKAASDDTTDPPRIEYDIWMSQTAGGEDTGSPPVVAVTGTLHALVGGLVSGQKYYFLVRAKDQDGNHDANLAELDATTLMPAPATRTLTTDVQPILLHSCSDVGRCHGPVANNVGREQGMDFSTVDSAALALLGNVPTRTNPSLGRLRVKAGDSGNSFITDKLLGILGPDDGSQMPYDNSLSPITDDQIRTISEWIDQGAMR